MTTINPTTSATVTQETGNVAQKSLAQNFDNFLKLLTMQLTHQDPTQPMDANQFTQQLVQFATVEQAIAENKKLEQLVGLLQTSQSVAAIAYIGKKVEAEGNKAELGDGKALWTYTLPKAAAKTVLLVRDAGGHAVAAATGETGAGKHTFTWNGKDTSGNDLPAGTYSLAITAVDASGGAIETKIGTVGKVTGVQTAGGKPVLAIGTMTVPFDSIVAITDG